MKNYKEEILTFMDLLDLDEDVIDSRLQDIMSRDSHSTKHLVSAINLLKYKELINIREDSECDNDCELEFVMKLINNTDKENIDLVCEIVILVLCLKISKLQSNAEHMIQQILHNICFPIPTDDTASEKISTIYSNFKLCNCILDATIKHGQKISLLFVETNLEEVLSTSNDGLKKHFLTMMVPKLFEGTVGYNILDKIWMHLKDSKHPIESALRSLSCLSEYYLPVASNSGVVKFDSVIVNDAQFWILLLKGLMAIDPSVRKMASYLIKRAIDCISIKKTNIIVEFENAVLFLWRANDEIALKQSWNNFFVLIDSLEEKQSNIVLPSLQLFESVDIPACWLDCAFNIGLKHDNTQVKLKCIEYRLRVPLRREQEAIILLEALNDFNIFDDKESIDLISTQLENAFQKEQNFVYYLQALSKVRISPIPFYYLSQVMAKLTTNILAIIDSLEVVEIINEILKLPINNIAIRKAVHINISNFIGHCCKGLQWQDFIKIFSFFKAEIFSFTMKNNNPFLSEFCKLNLAAEEKDLFIAALSDSYVNIHFMLMYLDTRQEDIPMFVNTINYKLTNIQNIVNRQYCDKTEYWKDVVYVTETYKRCIESNLSFCHNIKLQIIKQHKTIINYIASLLSSEKSLSADICKLLFNGFKCMSETINDLDSKDIILQLYKSCILLIKDGNTDLKIKVYSLFTLNSLVDNLVLTSHCSHEILKLEDILCIIYNISFKDTQCESSGRLRNVFYAQSSKFIYFLIKKGKDMQNVKGLLNYIEKVIECGGYGCLEWILKIMNKFLSALITTDVKFDLSQFIRKMWQEIEELKSNNQYAPCIYEFVNLICHEEILKRSTYNNTVISYCNNIVEYGYLKNTPLYYLSKKLNTIPMQVEHGQLIYVLCEVLLFSPVPKKDQRITDNIAVEILGDNKYGLDRNSLDVHFNYEIQYTSASTLCKINNPEVLNTITTFIINKIDSSFKTKQRYHGNSQMHRLLLNGLQNLLIIALLNSKVAASDSVIAWVASLLGRLPHQPSVRLLLEWYIALYIYLKKLPLCRSTMISLKFESYPIASQFIILYWALKHKVTKNTFSKDDYEFVLDTLLSHTMGQMFNTRLHAQYLVTKLHEMNKTNTHKYDYIMKVIQQTFEESCKDKNFMKLKHDFFVNEFDIVDCLTPAFVFYFLPRYCDVGCNENIDVNTAKQILEELNEIVIKTHAHNVVENEFLTTQKGDMILNLNLKLSTKSGRGTENVEHSSTIQKKYIPWKNMCDIEVCESGKKRGSTSELIVVASLIDKLPNLGGMARTSEVFGVNTYVIDSLRHLQDKQFQGLSVSAERWVNIEEVRPVAPLKEYLLKKKAEGYSLIAAEQTSTSCQLQGFKFDKKTLLLLGHEKEGVPCDLLPIMDQCVEVPQQGFVRSLNVHVTAAIFIWEYARQILLK